MHAEENVVRAGVQKVAHEDKCREHDYVHQDGLVWVQRGAGPCEMKNQDLYASLHDEWTLVSEGS